MKRKAHGAQKRGHINRILEVESAMQAINQFFLKIERRMGRDIVNAHLWNRVVKLEVVLTPKLSNSNIRRVRGAKGNRSREVSI
jgi:hypothetical protein